MTHDRERSEPASPRRLERLRAGLEARGLDGLLVSQPESRFYLSGFTGHDLPPRDSAGYLLVTPRGAHLLTDRRTSEQAEAEAGVTFEVVAYESRALGPARAAELARSLGLCRLGFEGIHLPYAVWHEVQAALDGQPRLDGQPEIALLDAGDLVDRLRVVKDAAELGSLQQAVDALDRCFAHLAEWLRPGLTERQVAREVERYLIEHADGPSFPPIVASGPNGSMPHAVPTDRVLREGDAITIDIGARASGYCSDMTRTVCLGQPRDPKLREVFAVVLEAHETAARAIRPGMTGREADAIARGVIEQAGFGDAFTHSLGHGIGLEVHEPPWLSRTLGDDPLEAGMVFSVEPGVYLPGWGGVRIEDLVVLEDAGPRNLCHASKAFELRGRRTEEETTHPSVLRPFPSVLSRDP